MLDQVPAFTVQDSHLAEMWTRFLTEYGREAVREAAFNYPEQRSVFISFNEIQLQNPELADYLLQRPRHALRVATSCLYQVDVPVEPKPRLALRVHDLPSVDILLPRQLRAEHLGRFVSIQGIVQTVVDVKPALLEAAFECRACGNLVHVFQDEDLVQEPVQCDNCERPTSWRLKEDMSRFVDLQRVIIQESPDALRGGKNPEALEVVFREDLVHVVEVGDKVILNGVPTLLHRRAGQKKKVVFDKVLEVVSVDPDPTAYADTDLTPEQEARFDELARRPGIQRQLAASFRHTIDGCDNEKLALLVAAVSAPTTHESDGGRRRGEIHVLLAGDPGTAKTQLMASLGDYVPRFVAAVGPQASGPGLAATTRQLKEDNRWIVEGGVLVMGDDGVVGIDELADLDDKAEGYLLESMESGTVTITTAAKARLRAAPAVVACMNPLHGGRFDPYNVPEEQLALTDRLRSRFDMIFCLVDRFDEARDLRVASRIIGDDPTARQTLLSPDELRRWIARARSITPAVSPAATERLARYFVDVRKKTRESLAFSMRQAGTLRRIALALARMRFSMTVDVQDADLAVDLLEASMRSRGIIDAGGDIDGDLMQFGQRHDQLTRNRMVLQAIKDLMKEHPRGAYNGHAREEDVLERVQDLHGIDEDEARKALSDLRHRNTIYARGGAGTWAPLSL